MSSPAVVVVKNVRKSYQGPNGSVDVLQGVDVSVSTGEIAAIQGASGNGKSTLLNIIGGLAKPDVGEVSIAGRPIGQMSPAASAEFRRRQIGFVFQRFNLLSGTSVIENILIPLRMNGKSGFDAIRSATAALERVGLLARKDHRVSALSVGEMQRAAIARAIVHEPNVLLADEPTGNLDSANKDAILGIFKELGKNAAIVIVTHDDHVAGQCSTRYALKGGKLDTS